MVEFSTPIEAFIYILDLFGTMAFAVTGAFKAIEHKADIVGIIILATITGVAGNILRKPTPIDYPYIVFEINTGGASCCTSYELYSKENLAFISKSESNKYSK